jgi:photosynthetic reaction center H subunit
MSDAYRDELVPLSEMKKFKVADEHRDIRGWRVLTSDGIRLGEIKELIVDRDAMKVRYMDVALNKDLFEREVDRRVLIPVGLARLMGDDKRVLLENTTTSELLRLPPYAPGPITRDYERSLRGALKKAGAGQESYDGDDGDRRAPSDFYDHDHFDSSRLYGEPASDPDASRR